jgi:hypothetical protein
MSRYRGIQRWLSADMGMIQGRRLVWKGEAEGCILRRPTKKIDFFGKFLNVALNLN